MSDGVFIDRRIDDGQPLQLLGSPRGVAADLAGFVVSTAVCKNPECTCTRMGLVFTPVLRAGEDGLQIDEERPELGGEVSADGEDLELDDDESGEFGDEITAWIRAELGQTARKEWLHERWCRMRAGIGDPAYASAEPPEVVDGKVFFNEVFRWDFDLTVSHEGQPYLASDCYCLEPDCSCDEVTVQFVDLSPAEGGETPLVGSARASIRRLRAPTFDDGPAVVRQLWSALLEQHGADVLRERFRRMREVARRRGSLPAPARAAKAKVGRNDPCPCGSGKKYKRCCGR
jgi:hypothetical protein